VCRDITERVRYEEELLRKDREISLHAEKVEGLNSALRVLVDHREQEGRQKDENIRATLDKLVLPYLRALKTTRLDAGQQGFVEILETNLENISSSFARELATWHEKLTPTEIQVADMVLAGKRSKEIASLLSISESAVAFHRANIRSKLGLKKKRSSNLVSYLRSLSMKETAGRTAGD
jgi:DNA-binding CsgD family transcriptional regulator